MRKKRSKTEVLAIGLRSRYAHWVLKRLSALQNCTVAWLEWAPETSFRTSVARRFRKNRHHYGWKRAIDVASFQCLSQLGTDVLEDPKIWPGDEVDAEATLADDSMHSTFSSVDELLPNQDCETTHYPIWETGTFDLTVLIGAPILSRQLLDWSTLTLNLHAGITPEYRGLYPTTWALARQDFDLVGFTVHGVSPKLDAGPVLLQRQVPFRGCNSVRAVKRRVVRAGSEAYLNVITTLCRGKSVSGYSTTGRGAVYSVPPLSTYMQAECNIRTLN